jgi:centriolar protein POC1
VYAVDWISDGTTVCGGGLDGKVNLWDVRSMKLIQHYDVSKKAVNSIATHPSGVYLS